MTVSIPIFEYIFVVTTYWPAYLRDVCLSVRPQKLISIMRHLPHTKKATLKPALQRERERIQCLLVECKGDVDLWCAQLGFDLLRNSSLLEEPMEAAIHGNTIVIREGLDRNEEAEAIAHEYKHYKFDASTAAYLTLDRFTINRIEGEAELFAKDIAGERFFI
jgi:hypothetical protein